MRNIIFNEDCIQTMLGINEPIIDLVVTSPPYDNLRTYKGYSFDVAQTSTALYRVVKPGGVVVWVIGDATIKGSETGTSFRHALSFMASGFRLHDTMIWNKTNAMPKVKTKRYFDKFEYMFIFSKGTPKAFNPIMQPCKMGGKLYKSTCKKITKDKERVEKEFVLNQERYRDNIWDIAVAQNKTAHPAVFPLQLAVDHVTSWSNIDDIVYDPFMGSGTTAIACIKTGRQFLGSEISAEYCEIARRRIEELNETD